MGNNDAEFGNKKEIRENYRMEVDRGIMGGTGQLKWQEAHVSSLMHKIKFNVWLFYMPLIEKVFKLSDMIKYKIFGILGMYTFECF